MDLKRKQNGKNSETYFLDGENVVAFDVDNTLIKWDKKHNVGGEKEHISIVDPYSKETIFVKPHTVHVRLLKQYKARGLSIIVWSHAGALWAKEVVNVLGLTDHVDLVMAKPSRHVDDKEAKEDIIGLRVYLEDREK